MFFRAVNKKMQEFFLLETPEEGLMLLREEAGHPHQWRLIPTSLFDTLLVVLEVSNIREVPPTVNFSLSTNNVQQRDV